MAQRALTDAHDEDISDYAVVTLIAIAIVSLLALGIGILPADTTALSNGFSPLNFM